MRFALAAYGTRGDVEPCAAVGLELMRRGHDVRMAVAPAYVALVKSTGISAAAYGPESKDEAFIRNLWKMHSPTKLIREAKQTFNQGWAELGRTLTNLADGADLLLTHATYFRVAANVAEYYDIPWAALNHLPTRPNGQIGFPSIPTIAPLMRSAMRFGWRTYHRITQEANDSQRHELGLPTYSLHQKSQSHDVLEIQAYDSLCFPGLAAEWTDWAEQRPFVGALTMELATDADEEIAAWIAAGTPPIYFGFGSTPLQSSADTLAMIVAACAELGERALIQAGVDDSTRIPCPDRIKFVDHVNYTSVLPACRAIVHHGGAGTMAAGMRAGIPQLILWTWADQPLWATQVKRLKIGLGRRLAKTTQKSLIADLDAILLPEYATRAHEIATQTTSPADSASTTADLLEQVVRARHRG